MCSFILASNSPRRKELLQQVNIPFKTEPSQIEEVVKDSLNPSEVVVDLAYQKAADVLSRNPQAVVLGADTIVVANHQILGKPQSKEDARTMLSALSGTEHAVLTGVAIVSASKKELFFEETLVQFWELTDEEIEAYITTSEPFDKAGAYGIQGSGATLVKQIKGDYFSVVGLPIAKVVRTLQNFGISQAPH
ncbi:Maf family protein [Alkalihalobacillus sp. LMS39]|uniref:Maf family protein n=1 Tax=Alkalihalobacillus sp. LMS39 TaxID=2924032 RepID=UPI001FB43935|nr:Maf family protein [Alkalihalobacillus sp. LMS39]UOE93303.1 Maf family protein [Alkalihalobacillus sp. LMS39]